MLKRVILLAIALLLLATGSGVTMAASNSSQKAGVDLMLVVAHPGDEYLYLGGVLSYYVSEKGYTAVVVYMTYEDVIQREEATAALKSLGVSDVVFGSFSPEYSQDEEEIVSVWDKANIRSFLVSNIRKYRPAVIVSHDIDGEYGDAAHCVTAEYVENAASDVANKRVDPDSAETYGVWSVQRIFLHLYDEDTISINRDMPLTAFGGRTSAEVEEDLYESFDDNYRYPLSVDDPVYSVADYGMVYSADDLKQNPIGDDMFYGISASLLNGPNSSTVQAASSLSVDAPALEEPSEDSYYRSADDPEEVVVGDWPNGHWEYKTDTLSIIIDRYYMVDITGQPIAFNIAHVRMRGEDAFRAGVASESGNGETREIPSDLARRYSAVLAVTGDNLSRGEPELKGIIIRNGKIYNVKKAMDCFVLESDLSMKIYSPSEVSAQQLLDAGITQAYSFGPTLIRDGVVNQNPFRQTIGNYNPRVGIGMVEPGHFVVIVVDGRLPDVSVGIKLKMFSHMFYALGCTQAYNLDGGSSAAMLFMGEYTNWQPRVVDERIPGLRIVPDLLLWGESDLVPGVDDPVEHEVYYD